MNDKKKNKLAAKTGAENGVLINLVKDSFWIK